MAVSKPRFYGVQILRGIAATLVLFHHQIMVAHERIPGTPVVRVLENGAFGVDLFFPISGFVMYLTAVELRRRYAGSEAWRDFAWRRMVRVVPLYWLATVLKLAIFVFAPIFLLNFKFLRWNVLGSFLFLPVFDHNLQPEPVVPVGWTLNAEMFFYALVAIALALRVRLLQFLLIIISLLSVAGIFYHPQISSLWQSFLFWINPIALEFAAGILLGAFLSRLATRSAGLAAGVALLAMTFALLVPVGEVFTFSVWRPLVWGVPGAVVVWAVLSLEPLVKFGRRRGWLLLGDASYSLYLTQTFVMPAFGVVVQRLHLTGARGLTVFFILSTAVTFAASIAVHLYVEMPMLRALSGMRLPWSARSAESTG